MRKPIFALSIFLFVSVGVLPTLSSPIDLTLDERGVHVYFSPHGGCTEAISKQIDQAK